MIDFPVSKVQRECVKKNLRNVFYWKHYAMVMLTVTDPTYQNENLVFQNLKCISKLYCLTTETTKKN